MSSGNSSTFHAVNTSVTNPRQQHQPQLHRHGSSPGATTVSSFHTSGGGGSSFAQSAQQRAAHAKTMLRERRMTSREIQAMLEKNEAAIRGWTMLQKQEPLKHLVKEHAEWVRKCTTYRQQIGARLEVLASLADKQIANEDESSAIPAGSKSNAIKMDTSSLKPQLSHANIKLNTNNTSQQLSAQPSISSSTATMSNSSTSSVVASSTPLTSPTVFPDPPNPINPQQFDYTSTTTSTGMFFPTGSNSMGSSTTNTLGTTSQAGLPMSNQPFSMAGGQVYTNNNTLMTPATTSTNAFMNQQNYLIAAGMNMANAMTMNPQFMAMQMQMNPMGMGPFPTDMFNNNMYSSNYGGMNNNQLPVDPFNASMAFGQQSFPSQMVGFNTAATGFSGQMNGYSMMQDPQMMTNNFQYGMGMMPQHQIPQQQQQQPPQQQFQAMPSTSSSMQPLQQEQQGQQDNSFADLNFFGDGSNNTNLFDGLPDDAFLQIQ